MENKKEQQPGTKAYLKYAGMGVQMAAIIGLTCWLGVYLDKRFRMQTPWWTVGLSIFGVAGALYMVLKEVIKMNKD